MTKLTNSLIKVILPLASLGFFLVASIIVLVISQGKKLEDDGSFVQTGIIRVNSIPTDNVKAFIDNKEVTFSDYRIAGIIPGAVNLKLTKDGYTPWEKQVIVESGIVKDIYAQLYPNTIPFSKVSPFNIEKTYFSTDGQFIYYTVINNTASDGIWRIKLTRNLLDFSNTQQVTQLIKFNEVQRNELQQNEYTLITSRDNNKMILKVGDIYYLYNLSDTSRRINLNDVIGINLENVQWFRDSQSIIFTQDNKYSFEYDLTTKETILIDYNVDSLSNFSITSNNVYFIRNNTLMLYTNNASSEYIFGSKLKNLIPPNLTNVYTAPDNSNTLILLADEALFYVDIQKGFIDVIDTKTEFYKTLSNGRLLTYFKNNVLHSYYIEDNYEDNTLEAAKFNLNITKDSFDNLEFAATGKNLVLFSSNKVTLMDYDGLNQTPILAEFTFIDNKLLFANNSTEIYSLIQEKDETGATVNNLYKFELKVK